MFIGLRRSRLVGTAAALIATAPIAVLGATMSQADAATAPPRPDHVVIVIEENHSASSIIGNRAAPYINSLATSGALFTNSYAVAHPSQPNYLALFSGSTQGVTSDACPAPGSPYAQPNLGAGLVAVGGSFIGYAEDLPSVGSRTCSSGHYDRKHNPWSDFSNVPASANQPFTSFPVSNFAALPSVSIVIPNELHNMHDGTVQQADTWLKSNLDSYVQWAKTHNSLLVVTWDEDDYSSANKIPTIFAGPMVKPGSYTERINHYNVLRTIEDMYRVAPAGNSGTATPITDVWAGTTATTTSGTGTATR
jgi:hypothetical protein